MQSSLAGLTTKWNLFPHYTSEVRICNGDWTEFIPADTIPIIRSRDTVMFFMVFRMKGYKGSGVLTRDKMN